MTIPFRGRTLSLDFVNVLMADVTPALACDNTLVVKPSEETPMTVTLLSQVINDAGAPIALTLWRL